MTRVFNRAGLFLLILSTISVYSCKKDRPEAPSITTTSVSTISSTTAVSGGDITNIGSSPVLSMGVCWSTSAKPTLADKYTTENTPSPFSSTMTQLTPNTLYYVRAYATNSNGAGYGNQVSFTTNEIAIPILTTTQITQITSTTAVSGGTITTDNGGLVTERGVCWGTAKNPTVDDSKTIDASGQGIFICSLTGLKPCTLYYVRAYASNSAGTAYGNQLTLQTPYDVLLTKENSILSGVSVINTFDGGQVVFGYIYKDNIPPYQITYWIPYLIKLDSQGNIIWETEVSINITFTPYQYADILETKEHKIVFCYESYVVMLDESGNVIWKFNYKTDEKYYCTSLIESDENNLFVLASNIYQTSLLKVSLNGELLLDKAIKVGDDRNYYCGYLLCKIDNGNYFLAGSTQVGIEDLHQRIWAAEINSTGDIIWENVYIDSYRLGECKDMTKTKDGGIIITGISMGNYNEYYARVIKLDSHHTLTWEKSYSWDYGSNTGYAIIQDSNGDYVFCGTQGYQQVKAILVKLNKDGDEIWKRTYWPENEMDFEWYLVGLRQISNGGYILVGTKTTLWGDAQPRGIWVKKVDQYGY